MFKKKKKEKKYSLFRSVSPLVTPDLLATVSETGCVGISTGCLQYNRD